jgi:DNA polymerase I-like protein with 3'-5' exonuclease and polymerase domains
MLLPCLSSSISKLRILETDLYHYTYKALNRLIQGSAADQTKQAVVDCYKEGYLPMLQIHDELCFSIKDDNDVKIIKDKMENCIKLKVPSLVDVALGKDFGEAL